MSIKISISKRPFDGAYQAWALVPFEDGYRQTIVSVSRVKALCIRNAKINLGKYLRSLTKGVHNE